MIKEALAKVRGALSAIEAYADEGKYEEAKSLMSGRQVDLSVGMSNLYDGLSEKIDAARQAAAIAEGQTEEQREAVAVFVAQMAEEVHSGVQDSTQAASRVHNKCGVTMQEAVSLVEGQLAMNTSANVERKDRDAQRPQAEIDAENQKTGVLEKAIEDAAEAAHAVVNLYRAEIKEEMQPDWPELSDMLKNSSRSGVRLLLRAPETSPEELHRNWMDYKLNEGWKFGEPRNDAEKIHPLLVLWDDLPEPQRRKGVLFRDTVVQNLHVSGVLDIGRVAGIGTRSEVG